MPRRRNTEVVDQSIEIDEEQFLKMFKERVVSLHLKNKFFEFATKAGEQFNCPICLNDIQQPEAYCLLRCGHHTCFSCEYYTKEPKTCPVCRE